jgi:hypothetical protein
MKNTDLKDRAQVNTTVAVWSFISFDRIRETLHHILCEATGNCTRLLTRSRRERLSRRRTLLILHFWAEPLSMSHDAEMLDHDLRHQNCRTSKTGKKRTPTRVCRVCGRADIQQPTFPDF